MAIIDSPERRTSFRVNDPSAQRTARMAARVSIAGAIGVAVLAAWWTTSIVPPPTPPRATGDPLTRAVEDALAVAAPASDRPFVDALKADMTKRESAESMLERMSPEAREAHARDVQNRVTVPIAGDRLRTDVHGLVQAAQKAARPDRRDATFLAALAPEVELRASEMRTVTVQAGDTLSAIALRAYADPNKYMRIYEANPRVLTNPHQLVIGMVLRVPL